MPGAYDPVFVREWAGEIREFRLGVAQQDELEEICDLGLPEIAQRLVEGRWRRKMIREAVRLSLIGSMKVSASDAEKLCRRYIDSGIEGCLDEAFPIAVSVVANAIRPPEALKKNLPGEAPSEATTTTAAAASTSASSTESAPS